MGKRIIESGVLLMFLISSLVFGFLEPQDTSKNKEPEKEVTVCSNDNEIITSNKTFVVGTPYYPIDEDIETASEIEVVEEPEYDAKYCIDQIDYIAACVQAEARNQGEYGMRLVADVIFNRIDDNRFKGDNAIDIINAPHQFQVVDDGALQKQLYDVKEETRKLVKEEALNRTDPYIIGFRTKKYGYGTPAYKYKDHYFSY